MSNPRLSLPRFARDRTAQSEPLAVILLVGLTVIGGGTIVVFGASAIDETTTSVDVGQAEHAMTQLDSKASLVAHGSSSTQRVDLGNGRGTTSIDENAGRMTVRIINGTGGNETIMDESLGAVTYQRERTTLAYQGGGVWRQDGSGSTMVSPPEFHYDGGTLTLPLVRVRGNSISGQTLRIVQRAPTDGRYPTNASWSNPLTQGRVHVTVESEYYQAWGRYFSERTSGDVTYDHANNTATIALITPFEDTFDNVLATTDGGFSVNGNGNGNGNGGDLPTPSETGVNYPSADSRIEGRIDHCFDDGCEDWTTDIDDAGTYYVESDVGSGLTVDTTNGDVALVVNGSFNPRSLDIEGNNNVTVYVNGDTTLGTANAGGDASQLRVLVHSSGVVDMNGDAVFVGLLYAPESDVDLNGAGSITGSVIGGSITVNGNPANSFSYNDSIRNVELAVGGGEPPVLYLHVSVTTVHIEDR